MTVPQLPHPVRLACLERVAQFRMPEYRGTPRIRAALVEAFARARPLAEGAASVAVAVGHVWHLLWTGDLTTDWDAPLLPTSLVWVQGNEAL
ncbi:hypothetical protein B4N89_46305 [Embleya scabrispora]|uniref:Uncharacterized protein n=1 Tax=Embleya scabrispora TaxID=159449 RepID=A0A1T3NHZ7_9ACTN|nr:hypothetical protein [Embleya scabrispora]OPC76464.1 hypothetical protein B4N89_46305 [Embleya scabrispora]